jgi:tetratricopeptide (TPR) repeat protein
MGARRAVALCCCFGGFLQYQLGDWQRAEAELRQAVTLYRDIGSASGEALSLQRLGVLLTARGQLEPAMTAFDEGLFAAERAVLRSHCLTRLYASMARNRLAAGDIPAAAQHFQAGNTTALRHGHCVTCDALLLPEAVRVALALGDVAAADLQAQQLEATARRFGSHAWQAMACQARGRVLTASHQPGLAYRAFGQAYHAFSALNIVYESARCLLGQAHALQAGADAAGAAEVTALQAQATTIFTSLGAAGIEG